MYYKFALEYCDSTDANFYQKYQAWGYALYWVDGRRDEAFEKFRRSIELGERQRRDTPDAPVLLAYLGSAYALLGEDARAEPLIERAASLTDDDELVMYLVGTCYEKLGNRERALHHLGNALRHRYSLAQIKAEPLLDDLVRDIRFQQLAEGSSGADGRDQSATE